MNKSLEATCDYTGCSMDIWANTTNQWATGSGTTTFYTVPDSLGPESKGWSVYIESHNRGSVAAEFGFYYEDDKITQGYQAYDWANYYFDQKTDYTKRISLADLKKYNLLTQLKVSSQTFTVMKAASWIISLNRELTAWQNLVTIVDLSHTVYVISSYNYNATRELIKVHSCAGDPTNPECWNKPLDGIWGPHVEIHQPGSLAHASLGAFYTRLHDRGTDNSWTSFEPTPAQTNNYDDPPCWEYQIHLGPSTWLCGSSASK